MSKNIFIKFFKKIKQRNAKNKQLAEAHKAAYLHLNVPPAQPKKTLEDIAARIFAWFILSLFSTLIWFGITLGIFVNPDSSLWLKIPLIALFVVGLCIIQYFLIRWVVTSKEQWKFDRNNNPQLKGNYSGNRAQHFLKNKSSSFYDNTSYCGLRGNKYNMHRR